MKNFSKIIKSYFSRSITTNPEQEIGTKLTELYKLFSETTNSSLDDIESIFSIADEVIQEICKNKICITLANQALSKIKFCILNENNELKKSETIFKQMQLIMAFSVISLSI